MTAQQDQIKLGQLLKHTTSLIPRIPSIVKYVKLARLEHGTEPVGLGCRIDEIAQQKPNNTAIVFEERSITYKTLNDWSNRIGNHFLSKGLTKGDSVTVFIPNSPELLAVIAGLNKIGVIPALVNTSQRQKVLHHSFDMVDPKANIISEDLLDAFNEVKDELKCQTNYFCSDCDTLSSSNPAPKGFISFEDALKESSSDTPDTLKNCMPGDTAFYIYTSGTTGLPKAVAFTNGRWLKAYASFGYAAMCLKEEDIMYVTLPFYHATALAICWGSVLAGEATLVLRKSFSASEFWNDIRKYKATSFGYVGELCRYLMNQKPSDEDLNNQVTKIVGNGLRPNIWKEFKTRFGITNIVELYASSEGNIGMTNLLNLDNTVGFCPFPYALVKYDQDAQAPVKDSKGYLIPVKKGDPGLLLGKISKTAQPASYTDKSKTEKLILKDVFLEGDKWFDTGDMMRDIGYRHLQFVDRLGDTFRWKGENVSTTELENVISEFDGIQEAVVYGVEIPETNGRAGMATIVPQDSLEETQAKLGELLTYLKNSLPAYAVPLFIRIKTDLDVTGTFKYKKSDLKTEAFNPSACKDNLYTWLPGETSYSKIDEDVYKKIASNEFRF